MDLFLNRREALLAFCIEHRGRHTRFDWTAIDRKTVDLQRCKRVSYEQPVDEHWDYSLYVSKTAYQNEDAALDSYFVSDAFPIFWGGIRALH